MIKLPKISIITPSFNQSQFIGQTIKSVLSQGYPDYEHIVIDGGSTDDTLQILKKYSNKLRWISEKDKGQSQAINKGLKMATGEIIGYLNSDDYLEKNCLNIVGEYFVKNKNAYWLTGKCKIVDKNGQEVRKLVTLYKNFFLKFARHKSIFYLIQYISQPATFWRKKVINATGSFDEDLHYDMDYDYWLRVWQKYPLDFTDEYLSFYRVHQDAKAVVSPETQFQVEFQVIRKYTNSKLILALHKLHSLIALFIYRLFFIR